MSGARSVSGASQGVHARPRSMSKQHEWGLQRWRECEKWGDWSVCVLSSRLPLPLCCFRYRYLLHLDGQSCSSRLEQLLVLNSLVLKEESGYVAFYHHLLKEYKHYLPVWRQGQGPEDVLDAVRWAREHDEAAQQVAQNAQQVMMGRGKGWSGGAEGLCGKWRRNAQQVFVGDRGQKRGKQATNGWGAGRGRGKGARQHAGARVGESS